MRNEDKIIKSVRGTAMPLEESDLDTDIIIRSRYLLTIDWKGVGKGLLHPRKFGPNGEKLDTVLNDPRFAGAAFLFLGNNSGCGSSREHAPQAIKQHYKAIVAGSFAGIFDDNCYAIGLPAVTAMQEVMGDLFKQAREHPETEFYLNLENRRISYTTRSSGDDVIVSYPIEISDANREGFLEGEWDERDALLANMGKVRELAAKLGH